MSDDWLASLRALQAAEEGASAASACSQLCAELLAPHAPPSPSLDEHSFDLFPPLARASQWSECTQLASQLLTAIVEAVSPREAYCLIMEAIATRPPPRSQLLLLSLLAGAFPRIRSKRTDFIMSCVGSLYSQFLEEWPASDWDVDHDQDDVLFHTPSSCGGPSSPCSSQLLFDALHAIASPLVEEAAGAEASDREVHMLTLLLAFCWRLLELSDALKLDKAKEMTLALLARCEIESPSTLLAMLDHPARVDADRSEASEERKHPTSEVGIALHIYSLCVESPAPPSEAEEHEGGRAPLCGQLSRLKGIARFNLAARVGVRLVREGGQLAVRGHALIRWGLPDGPEVSGEARWGPSESEEMGHVEECVRRLVGHMASHQEQQERSLAHRTVERLLWMLEPAPRLELLRTLIRRCPFPNAVALLITRLKDEHLHEARGLLKSGRSDARVFGVSTLIRVLDPLLEGFSAQDSDPVASVDSLMAALNLTRFILVEREEKVAHDTMLHFCRSRLEPLDLHLRRCMDGMWRRLQAVEQQGSESGSDAVALVHLRQSFTYMHLAAEVAQRAIELCKHDGC